MRRLTRPSRSRARKTEAMKKNLKSQSAVRCALVALLLALSVNQMMAMGEVLVPMLRTTTGEFKNVRIFNRTGTHLSFAHDNGTAVIKVEEVEADSLAAIERAQSGQPEPAAEAAGAVVVLAPKPDAAEEPVWLAQSKKILSQLQLNTAALDLDRKFVWTVLGGMLIVWWFYCLCCSLICKKAGQPGGMLVWVPALQMIPLFRAAGMSGWWFVGMFIPLLNLIGQILWCVKIAQARGKGFLTAVLLILPGTNILAFLYLAFSNGDARADDNYVPIRPPHALAVN